MPNTNFFNSKILTSIDEAAALFSQMQPTQPFWHIEFWQALEQQHAIGKKTGWEISHILLESAGQPVAFMPLFIKSHHRGEYVFDHAWAQAYARHGLNYYPRLVSSVPFTPVTGSRILMAQGYDLSTLWSALFECIQQISDQHQASSWHGLFIDKPFADFLQHAIPHLAIRHHCQFLWENKNYQQFDDFLADLTAKKRKSIKVERQKIIKQGIECQWIEGKDITTTEIDFFYTCYTNTYAIRGQKPYLNQQFFTQLMATMPEQILLIIAEYEQQPIAAALFFKDQHILYGRYWGSVAAVDCLHFEVCYYQGIEYAILHQLKSFDPGTQGEHKLIRGFAPVYTYSAHWLAQPEFMHAVENFCQQEQQHIAEYYQAALASTPFKQTNVQNENKISE